MAANAKMGGAERAEAGRGAVEGGARERPSTICCSSRIAADGRQVRAAVKGDRDPGYGSTSKMIAECAICLLRDTPEVPGGIWTPGAAMGDKLIKRLVDHAGLTFDGREVNPRLSADAQIGRQRSAAPDVAL